MKPMKSRGLYCLCLLVLLVSCSKREAKEKTDALPEIYPDYIGVTVPENICPLNFSMPEAEYIRAVVENDKGKMMDVSGSDHVEMPVDDWHELLKGSQELNVTVSAWDTKHPDGVTYKPFTINSGDRIAQMIFAKCEQADLVQVETLSVTERGAGGFGHTGKNRKPS